MRLDDRTIRIDRDWGFVEGRQYGRGKSGGQVRDEYRMDFDLGRGGFGKMYQVAGATDIEAAQSAAGIPGALRGDYSANQLPGSLGKRPPPPSRPAPSAPPGEKRGREEDDDEDLGTDGRRRRGRREGDASDSD
mmetsp:Transcript_22302/g.34944  ORF Transcript_22302/g.34944 Transcript_22302/m.34944 type:complete len:134 (-) Transcript_22302:62-463(-)